MVTLEQSSKACLSRLVFRLGARADLPTPTVRGVFLAEQTEAEARVGEVGEEARVCGVEAAQDRQLQLLHLDLRVPGSRFAVDIRSLPAVVFLKSWCKL